MIKDWWDGLAEREQKILSVGGVVLLLILLYLFAWSPISSTVNQYRDSISRQQHLLSYLTRASQAIDRLRASGVSIVPRDEKDLTTHAETVFSLHGVSGALKQVHQIAKNEVAFSFESVRFDKLMFALHSLAQSDVNVKAFSATRKPEDGVVDAEVVLVG